MWVFLRDVILGIEKDPKVVAAVRAILLIGLPWAIEVLVAKLTGFGVANPQFVGIAGATALLARTVGESALDIIKQNKFGIGNNPDANPATPQNPQ